MRKFVAVKSRQKLSQVGSWGMNAGGWAKTSGGGLNEVETIQKKGKAAWRVSRYRVGLEFDDAAAQALEVYCQRHCAPTPLPIR